MSDFEIDIAGIDKADLLAALYNCTRSRHLGRLHDLGRELSRDEAAVALSSVPQGPIHFDYLMGRPIKVTFDGDRLLRPDLYDRDAPAGKGSCQRIVDELRKRQPS